MKYVNLNLKTGYSFLESIIKINDLINFAKKNNITNLAITEKNAMYSSIDFYIQCIKNDIKPIIGIEIVKNDLEFIIFAKNNFGYKELCQLNYLISNNEISKKDILALKNCYIIVLKNYEEYPINQDDNFFVGKKPMQVINFETEKIIPITSVNYLEKEDKEVYNIFQMIGKNEKLDEVEDKYNQNVDTFYFLFDEDFEDFFTKKELINLTNLINNINLEINLNQKPQINFLDEKEAFKKVKNICEKNLKELFNPIPNKYQERLDHELKVINDLEFSNYFLIVYDYVQFAKEKQIIVGSGRGSVGGSLIAYLLKITAIDPIKFNLLFERFLNPERVTMPDIDIDFQDELRDQIINYLVKKYGFENIAQIVTYQTLKAKMSLRDVGRVLNVDLKEIDNLSKMIPDYFTLEENYSKSKNFKEQIDSSIKKTKLFKIAKKIEGLPRQAGTHAAGIVIAHKKLIDILPVEKTELILRTQISMDYLENLGLLKMDILGLKTLTTIKAIIDRIQSNHPKEKLDLDNIVNFDDKDVFELLSKGDTLGIFQLETPSMKKALLQIKPKTFEDIVATTSLNRPGPQIYIKNYALRKDGIEEITYYSNVLKPILESTYGIIIYQEQIMQIAQTFANFSLAKADLLRRAISKKQAEKIEELKKDFIEGAKKNNIEQKTIIAVYNSIYRFSDYGFNRSHAIAYSILSYKMAYLKCHYFKEFYIELLNANLFVKNKALEYFEELEKINIKPVCPSINENLFEYQIEAKVVKIPLLAINGLGHIAIKEIENERNRNGNFVDFIDFLIRATLNIKLNKKVIQSIIESGGLDLISKYNRATMFNSLNLVQTYANLIKSDNEKGYDYSLISKPKIEEISEWEDLTDREFNAIGLMLSKSSHFNNLRTNLEQKYKMKFNLLKDLLTSELVIVLVKVLSVKEITTKYGQKMAFVSVQDDTGKTSLTIFPNFYKQNIPFLIENKYLIVKGKVDQKRDLTIIISSILEVPSKLV